MSYNKIEYTRPVVALHILTVERMIAASNENLGDAMEGRSKDNGFDRDLDNYKDVEIPVDHYNPWEDWKRLFYMQFCYIVWVNFKMMYAMEKKSISTNDYYQQTIADGKGSVKSIASWLVNYIDSQH